MGEHTPGPWEVATAIVAREVVEYFIRRPGDDIAIASDIIDPETERPSAAIAALIAAAPRLLAACVELLRLVDRDYCPDCRPDGGCDSAEHAVIRGAVAAIAEARGEVQG